MKIELVEDLELGNGTMYAVRADDSTIKWFAKKEEAEALYNAILADPNVLKPKRNILKSDEIVVSLES